MNDKLTNTNHTSTTNNQHFQFNFKSTKQDKSTIKSTNVISAAVAVTTTTTTSDVSVDKNLINGIQLNSNSTITIKQLFYYFYLLITLELDEPDPDKILIVQASTPTSDQTKQISYTGYKVIGNGSFGVVFQATLIPENKQVAIKKVMQDKRFKNRELQIMKLCDHTNVVKLNYYFYSTGDMKNVVFLNLVLDFVPETIYKASRYFSKLKQVTPMFSIKLWMYQVFRSLAYIHALGICHRDIKPQNLVTLNRITLLLHKSYLILIQFIFIILFDLTLNI